ncbi:MAG: hypothetical protein JSV68_08690, partial [Anaerolineaceae bacterium]
AIQMATANVGAWGVMIGGLVVTAVYFTLNSELINGRLDDMAVMTVSILGGLLIVLGIGGNFALGFVYRNGSAEHTKASNVAELRAMKTTARHAADKETTQAALTQTLDRIRRSLPNVHNGKAERMRLPSLPNASGQRGKHGRIGLYGLSQTS